MKGNASFYKDAREYYLITEKKKVKFRLYLRDVEKKNPLLIGNAEIPRPNPTPIPWISFRWWTGYLQRTLSKGWGKKAPEAKDLRC